MTVIELIESAAAELDAAGVSFGHGTTNAFDEAAWLVLWRLGIPLDTLDSASDRPVAHAERDSIATLLRARIESRKPAAYLTGEAWLQGVPFTVDERAIVPRSLIAEVLAGDEVEAWLRQEPARVLDLCTGNGSLAVLAALRWPGARVDASDVSIDALAVARTNVERHGLAARVALVESDGLAALAGRRYDLVLCNPPYVNAASMAALPPEYRAEPVLALAGGTDGMDFVRRLMKGIGAHLAPRGVVVLEVGNERAHFESAFPRLEAVWLETSAGDDQVLLVTRDAFERFSDHPM